MIRPVPTPESARASLARLQAALTQYQRDNPPVRRSAVVVAFPGAYIAPPCDVEAE